ncbi:hypothetical protein T11_3036 [Trichinella zimbabwensis]|uniref:Uncharacterized protein n=1 Tax=Trichinella zimbabwensis TaxID=268475 RepID=A0A0V1H0R7_9BILA|nr:hypothetical protein T11_3036 [Trichinella zimbabwensis]
MDQKLAKLVVSQIVLLMSTIKHRNISHWSPYLVVYKIDFYWFEQNVAFKKENWLLWNRIFSLGRAERKFKVLKNAFCRSVC